MSQYLFHLSIGPVQSFLAQSRKTQDLAAASSILSDLAWVAIDALNPLEYIIPSKEGHATSLPNRLLCIVETENPPEIGAHVEDKIRKKFREIAEESLKNSGLNMPSDIWESPDPNDMFSDCFREQIDQHLEINWTLEPINGNYQESYGNASRKMTALKSLRSFQQSGGGDGEEGRKCSLDGERNALLYKKGGSRFWASYAKEFGGSSGKLKENEGLSAPGIVKRFYRASDSFPSTVTISLLHDLESPGVAEKRKEYEEIFTNGFGEEWLFQENLTLQKVKDPCLLKNAEEKFKALRLHDFLTTRSYALVVFDGDNMGKWMSGGLHDPEDGLKTFQQTLSAQLGCFAEKARKILTNKRGRTVYAGGDDFIGMVNLYELQNVIAELKGAFKEIVNKEKFRWENRITISFGIVIAHYKTPLNEALAEARRLIGNAKDRYPEKNATGIAWLTRSSVLGEAYCKNDSVDILFDLARCVGKGEVSSTFLFNYIREMTEIVGELPDADAFFTQVSILRSELKRLMDRATPPQFRSANEEHLVLAVKLFESTILEELDLDTKQTTLNNFTSFVKIAEKLSFLSNEKNGAQLPLSQAT